MNIDSPASTGGPTARRRSPRIQIEVPVLVSIRSGASVIEEPAKTVRINAHGCLIYLNAPLARGQEVSLVNAATQEDIVCTVSFLGKADAGQPAEVGLEFARHTPFFWRIHFPPENWDPSERKLPAAFTPFSNPRARPA